MGCFAGSTAGLPDRARGRGLAVVDGADFRSIPVTGAGRRAAGRTVLVSVRDVATTRGASSFGDGSASARVRVEAGDGVAGVGDECDAGTSL
jgi:hypothetical protein